MKNIKSSLFGITMIAALVLSSCATTKEATIEAPLEHTPIAIKEIGNGALFGYGSEGFGEVTSEIIQSQEEWQEFRLKLNKNNEAQKDVSIDFEKRTVIGFFDAIRGSGGHSIEIVEVIETKEGLIAHYKCIQPEGDAIDVMTQPFYLISIPKTNKTIRFEKVTE